MVYKLPVIDTFVVSDGASVVGGVVVVVVDVVVGVVVVVDDVVDVVVDVVGGLVVDSVCCSRKSDQTFHCQE